MKARASSPPMSEGETRIRKRVPSLESGRFAFSPCLTFIILVLPSLATTRTRGSLPNAKPTATLPSKPLVVRPVSLLAPAPHTFSSLRWHTGGPSASAAAEAVLVAVAVAVAVGASVTVGAGAVAAPEPVAAGCPEPAPPCEEHAASGHASARTDSGRRLDFAEGLMGGRC